MKLAAQDSVNPGKEENITTPQRLFKLISCSSLALTLICPLVLTIKVDHLLWRIEAWVMSFCYLNFLLEAVGNCRTIETFVMIVDTNYGKWCYHKTITSNTLFI